MTDRERRIRAANARAMDRRAAFAWACIAVMYAMPLVWHGVFGG